VLKAIIIGLIIYMLFIAFVYFTQRNMMYYPEHRKTTPAQAGVAQMQVVTLKTADNLQLQAWYHPAKKNLPTLVYLHGNAGHIGYRGFLVRPYIKAGYGVLLVTYRGYSGNPGKPTEKGLYQDGRAAIKFLQEHKINPKCIVLIGESLGSAVAIQIASEFKVGAVIVQAAFSSMVDVGRKHYPYLPVRLLLKDRYDSMENIKKINTPILFIHGEDDWIIPIQFGRKLYAQALPPKETRFYVNRGHNNLPDVSPVVISFINKYVKCQG